MKLFNRNMVMGLTVLTTLLFNCKKDTDDTGGGISNTVPEVYQKIYGASSITSDGTYITIKTTGAPDHKSVYYSTANALYEAFSGPLLMG